MKTRKLLTTFSIVLFTTAVLAQGSSTNLQATLINTDPVPVQSGEAADLRFKVVNEGDIEADNVKVRLMDNYPFKVKPDRQRNFSLGEMFQSQEYQISTEVLVAEDAPDGENDFKVEIITDQYSVTEEVPVEVQSDDIELNLANLKTTPSELMPDTEDNKISLEVVNNGEKKAENVLIDLDLPEFFERTSSFSTRKSLGNIEAGETKSTEFKFDINQTAPQGEVGIPATISYTQDDSTAEIQNSENFNLYISGKPQFKITETSSNLIRGSRGEVEIEVENIGEEKSSSTRIRVLDSADQPFSYSSSSSYIGTLDPGQEGKAVFNVETGSDAPMKEYLVDFEVRGVKDTEVFTEDTTVKLPVEKGSQGSENLPIPLLTGLIIALAAGGYLMRDKIKESLGGTI